MYLPLDCFVNGIDLSFRWCYSNQLIYTCILYRKVTVLSNLIDHATRELTKAGLFDKNSDYDGMLGDAALELITTFANQGHSGMSAEMTTQLFERLSRFKEI